MTRNRRRPPLLATAIVLASIGSGMAAGAIFGERSQSEEEQALVLRASHVVTTLLDWLPQEHDPADIVYDGIAGMLQVLDPHSNYLDPRSFQKMRERQEGSFFGVGIIISSRNGEVTVISPIAGTPAAQKGLRAGDVIVAVEGERTEEMSLDDVVDRVRGPEGSTVQLTIRRPGMKSPFEVSITRARIPQTSIRYGFMVRPGVGYVRLSEFSNTSTRELREALQGLAAEGMESLVLDLRNNPGGSLDAAVGVADTFLREGELIVTTRGRTGDNNLTYRSPGEGYTFEGPLVVLVNEGSASASEIVAGAVQDHDRGLVLGETTWGKGLVQTVFSVRDTGLALTTARYYTPSGRCIQRDYRSFIDYITHRNGVDDDREIYETDAGRTVLGGGGISPDVEVVNRTFSDRLVKLYGSSAFFRFAIELLKAVPTEEETEFGRRFAVDEATLDRLFSWLLTEEILTEDELAELRADPQDLEDVRRGITVEIRNSTLGLNEGYRVALEGDDQLGAALDHIDEAADLWSAYTDE